MRGYTDQRLRSFLAWMRGYAGLRMSSFLAWMRLRPFLAWMRGYAGYTESASAPVRLFPILLREGFN